LHSKSTRQSSGLFTALFFFCPGRYIAQDRGIMDNRQCMQLIPFEYLGVFLKEGNNILYCTTFSELYKSDRKIWHYSVTWCFYSSLWVDEFNA